MYFDADRRIEWIYRGSTRLSPLYLEILKANARQQLQQSDNAQHRIPAVFNKSNLPYVEYASNIGGCVTNVQAKKATIATSIASSILSTVPQQSRAVAKKSTAKRQSNIDATYNSMIETKPSHSIVTRSVYS